MYGQDPGFFLDQAQTADLTAKLFGFEFTPDGVNASKGAYDSVGWTFAYDYFDAKQPDQPAGQAVRRRSSRREYGEDPDFYAANFYENMLVMWEVIRRVLAKGGDINDGAAARCRASRRTSPSSSVYGGDDPTVGTLHPRPDDPLRDQAPDGRVHLQGREGHAAGLLRHRWRGLQDGLSPCEPDDERRASAALRSIVPGACMIFAANLTWDAVSQLTVIGIINGAAYGAARRRLRAHPRRQRPLPLRLQLHLHPRRLPGVLVRRPGRRAVLDLGRARDARSAMVVGVAIERFIYRALAGAGRRQRPAGHLRGVARHRHRRSEPDQPAVLVGVPADRRARSAAHADPLGADGRSAGSTCGRSSRPSSSCSA